MISHKMRINIFLVGLSLFATLQALPNLVAANDSDSAGMGAEKLLSTMSAAIQSLTYEGTLVHKHNGQTDVVRILHAKTATGEHERMSSLNGEAREIYRNDAQVVCIWPNGSNVIVTRAKPRTALKAINSKLIDSSMYTIESVGSDRVAGVSTDVLAVHPLDDFRYGYRFWIDQDTGMMLRSVVLDADNRAVEEMIFTDIKYLDSIDPELFVAPDGGDKIEYEDLAFSKADDAESSIDKVSFKSLPNGYTERSESLRMVPVQKDDPVSHVVVSDGIASVSVYVEYVTRTEQDSSTLGAISMGAMNAYGFSLPDAMVTAVGEVPERTVEAIARAVRLAGE